jgi:hypothetical protein
MFYNWITRAYRRLPKSAILTAPLGARTRTARLSGVFSSAKPPKKRILEYLRILQSANDSYINFIIQYCRQFVNLLGFIFFKMMNPFCAFLSDSFVKMA